MKFHLLSGFKLWLLIGCKNQTIFQKKTVAQNQLLYYLCTRKTWWS